MGVIPLGAGTTGQTEGMVQLCHIPCVFRDTHTYIYIIIYIYIYIYIIELYIIIYIYIYIYK